MDDFTVTASGNSCLAWAKYSSTSWEKGLARCGVYESSKNFANAYSRVGIMIFNGIDIAFKDTKINSVIIKFVTQNAGQSGTTRSIVWRKSKIQGMDTSVKGSAYVGDAIITSSGLYYSGTHTITLNKDTNADAFNTLCEYFSAGNNTLVIFNSDESQYGSQNWSKNYCCVNSCTITVEYVKGGILHRWNGTSWSEHTVQAYINGEWVDVTPHCYKNGEWKTGQ